MDSHRILGAGKREAGSTLHLARLVTHCQICTCRHRESLLAVCDSFGRTRTRNRDLESVSVSKRGDTRVWGNQPSSNPFSVETSVENSVEMSAEMPVEKLCCLCRKLIDTSRRWP
jgi:hypothetical protein